MHSSFLRANCIMFLFLAWTVPAAWADTPSMPASGSITSKPFGRTPEGQLVTLYTLTNKNGVSVSIMNYGATIVKILTPDRHGKLGDIVLGFDKFSPYPKLSPYFGATVGRYANRIAKGRFQLGKTVYQLPINNGPNALHGGLRGFDKRIWKVEPVESDVPALRFSRLSPDGEEGYPGNLFASVTFSLNDNNELRISYEATTDKPTIINLTNHSYFNLSGGGTVRGDILTIHADAFTPVDATLIPTGEIKNVEGTPWDLRTPTPIGLHLKETGGNPVGYDHNFILNKGLFSDWSLAAEVYDPKSGRTLKVSTDQPGIQFYSGNFLDGSITGADGNVYYQYDAFCLETQHFPDSPNHDNFPSTVLNPGDTYKTSTVYAFGVK
ncbi:MAG TPA: aldose epimerase family protein [Candidatus Methylacidiphilales bacterium]|jgi:aldose 1-epimerase|nr:aldose epimerase family protein [Candidatus Methylacidiphilales bacterium]